MNQICQMQALNSIFAAIAKFSYERKDWRLVAELSACGQAVLYAPDDEAKQAWVTAQELIRGA